MHVSASLIPSLLLLRKEAFLEAEPSPASVFWILSFLSSQQLLTVGSLSAVFWRHSCSSVIPAILMSFAPLAKTSFWASDPAPGLCLSSGFQPCMFCRLGVRALPPPATAQSTCSSSACKNLLSPFAMVTCSHPSACSSSKTSSERLAYLIKV